MQITKSKLQDIILEEANKLLKEQIYQHDAAADQKLIDFLAHTLYGKGYASLEDYELASPAPYEFTPSEIEQLTPTDKLGLLAAAEGYYDKPGHEREPPVQAEEDLFKDWDPFYSYE